MSRKIIISGFFLVETTRNSIVWLMFISLEVTKLLVLIHLMFLLKYWCMFSFQKEREYSLAKSIPYTAHYLDIVSGTKQERGILEWSRLGKAGDETVSRTYDIPLIQKYLDRCLCLRFVLEFKTFRKL